MAAPEPGASGEKLYGISDDHDDQFYGGTNQKRRATDDAFS